MMKQKTIKNEFTLSGVGLHTGSQGHVRFKPAGVNAGITFIRVDLPGKPVIKADPTNVFDEEKISRCTTIGKGEASIHTIEHLMGALAGLGITNLTVEIDANEVPGLDGSSLEFVKALHKAGIVEQDELGDVFAINEPIGVERNGASIYAFPSEDFKVSYALDYPHSILGVQYFSRTITQETFEKEIAPCRTFCLESEAQELKKQGLGQGANYQNTLVVGEKGVIDNQLRFADEFVRHKVLDLVGDLYLLGVPLKGHFYAVKSGHRLNIQLLQKIHHLKRKMDRKACCIEVCLAGKKEIDIKMIMDILPHRYPFLLVDRVYEIEAGHKAVGIKNVTINESFFQGHFPTRPVMPGVLMVEAMAQTAGVLILTSKAHQGKLAFFMAADNVKFRKVVAPGDQLVMEVELLKDKARTAQVYAQARVGSEIVAQAEMVFSFGDDSYLA
ncbi:MAG: bifunctional UDP-3-O-[3-hydroxymyristoyl] N-acetylglucosamine deacetylase/3-hydroxyacyl-ACP dehydratase [Candidatus Omnitrophota bacterium]|jgi:UDP-3-O-[3-hydroxymyristoyl] N-acetylglucosamine deacetylase/3-hydroxyacyl-[acyl-carrier-protein] dehydratase|nr:bifunctional UDP-3-O-[3-hydroxymyristoyl] N-acetylglucosamine deacetylase/3-hydroxyacyl-ACP dehydratase [Candidatus Omnitrophota bacterium]